jgi:hypothetical protein
VPILPGVVQANRFAVLFQIRQDHHLGMTGLVKGGGGVHLQLAEARAERRLSVRGEALVREA